MVRLMLTCREFPSPCGEKVGINTQTIRPSVTGTRGRFPSPCGEKVGINMGFVFPGVLHVDVSVPLRGKGRDQLSCMGLGWDATSFRFPSPCGEKVGINNEYSCWKELTTEVSVPLRGKGRDQQGVKPLTEEYRSNSSFRPLAGKR